MKTSIFFCITISLVGACGAVEGIEGDWEGRFKLQVEKTGDNTWRILAKAVNSIYTSVTESDGKFTSGSVGSTEVGILDPNLRELEQEAESILKELTGIKRESENLILEGAGKIETFTASPGAGAGSIGSR